MVTSFFTKFRNKVQEITAWLGGFFYGMMFYEYVRYFRKDRADLEHLFVLISFGDLLGLPILPPYYSMRLLPYIVPLLNSWKRRMLRERDLLDRIG
ncbi:MAG TPA: hypothetical protein VLA49_22295 [Anaerolineales bacterium]|nr:hypothetical protein [Anaerolineales bacterium]